MGVAAALGYAYEPVGRFQRLMQAFGSTRVGAWLFSKTLVAMDRVCRRLSKGRTSVPQLLAGLPVVFVTTNGRRSGLPRTTPLIGVPIGEDLALIGTNFGQAPTPAWALNLEVDPSVHLSYRDAEVDAVARPATEDEREAIWDTASTVYAGYGQYRSRIRGREVRIFILETLA